jgi:AcrR family transcriptional regulator
VKAAEIRARARAQMVEEIKAIARRQLATGGADLSLRAVARDLGVVSSAIYRYFPSRDDLLTALILDAYNRLGAAVEKADAGVPRDDLAARFRAACHAVRDWALESPHEYALIYGSPVPGYRAPQDTIGPATRVPMVLIKLLADAHRAGALGDPPDRLPVPQAVLTDAGRSLEAIGHGQDVPPDALARGMLAWIQLFGAINFELFGHLNSTIQARDAFFDHNMARMAALIGLSVTTPPPASAAHT